MPVPSHERALSLWDCGPSSIFFFGVFRLSWGRHLLVYVLHSIYKGGVVGKLGILKEFWDFLKVRKKWWLTPIVVVMVLLGALIVFSQGSTVAPFIYTLF